MNAATALTLEELLGRQGATAPALAAEVVRELAAEDLLALAEPRGVQPSALKRVRTIHHQIAQALAAGERPIEVAAVTGYSLSRISILQGDPLFQELMAFYTEQETQRFADLQQQIHSLGRAATEELFERVTSEEVEIMTNADLRKIAEMSLDRSGHSPVQRKQSLRVTLSKQELDELKGRVDAGRTDRIFEAAVERDTAAGMGGDDGDRAAGPEAEEAEGVQSARDDV